MTQTQGMDRKNRINKKNYKNRLDRSGAKALTVGSKRATRP